MASLGLRDLLPGLLSMPDVSGSHKPPECRRSGAGPRVCLATCFQVVLLLLALAPHLENWALGPGLFPGPAKGQGF